MPQSGVAHQEADDAALVARAGRGDRVAFGELVRRLGDPCWALALHTLAGRTDLAEQALERAWGVAWRAVPTYDGRVAVRLWLLAIVARSCEQVGRRGCGAPGDPLSRALVGLPWAPRTAWVLHEVQGLSTRDTAVVLDLPDLVVRQVLGQARDRLREALEG